MPTIAVNTTFPEKGVARATWTGFASGSLTGATENFSRYRQLTVQVKGTFAGATVAVEGSIDGSNFQTLNDTRGEGNAASFTAANIVQLNEVPPYVRPVVTAASNLTSLDVVMVGRSPR